MQNSVIAIDFIFRCLVFKIFISAKLTIIIELNLGFAQFRVGATVHPSSPLPIARHWAFWILRKKEQALIFALSRLIYNF